MSSNSDPQEIQGHGYADDPLKVGLGGAFGVKFPPAPGATDAFGTFPMGLGAASDVRFPGTKTSILNYTGQPQAPPAPVQEATQANPFTSLAAPQSQVQPTAPNFDSVVNEVLNSPTPIQGADTPMEQPQAAAPKAPKGSPLFGDLNVHIQPNTTPLTDDDRMRESNTTRESIF